MKDNAPSAWVSDIVAWNAVCTVFGQALPMRGSATVTLAADATGPEHGWSIWRSAVLGEVYVALASFPYAQVAGIDLSAEALDDLPPALSAGLQRAALDHLRALLPDPLGAAQPTAFDAPAPSGLQAMTATVGLSGASAPAVLHLRAATGTIHAIARQLAPAGLGGPRGLPDRIAATIPVRFALEIGRHRMALSSLRRLQPGDAVLCRDLERKLVQGRIRIALAPDGNGQWTMGAPSMDDDVSAEQAAQTDTDARTFEDIPVRLGFVLQDVEMTLAELQALAPGAVLPVATGDPAPGLSVSITANGRRVGEGALIEIDGAPAVRIARLNWMEDPKG